MAKHDELAARTSPNADSSNTEGVACVSVERTGEAARGSSGGDADDKAHTAELEVAFIVVSSPGREAQANAEPVETEPPSVAAAKAEV
jgi:hypothetical protein